MVCSFLIIIIMKTFFLKPGKASLCCVGFHYYKTRGEIHFLTFQIKLNVILVKKSYADTFAC